MIRSHDTFYTIEEYKERILELDVESIQLSKGRFKSSQTRVTFDDMYLSTMSGSGVVSHTTQIPYNVYYLLFAKGVGPLISEGIQLPFREEALLYSPNEFTFSVFPQDFECYNVVFYAQILERYFEPDEVVAIQSLSLPLRTGRIRFNNAEVFAARAKTLVQRLLNSSTSQLLNETLIYDYFFSEFRHALSPFLTHAQEIPSVQHAHSVVRRAMEYLRSTAKTNVTVLELAENCFTSVRNLQICFLKALNMSPKHYLIIRRLHYIRFHLISASPATLTKHADDLSIKNISRLNQQYSAFFGESLQQTLAITE